MATRGRKPLPTAIKLLEGDRGKGRRPINKDEPTPSQENVKCPAWLMPEAKKEWKRLAPALMAMGILTDHDLEAFAGYCQAYADGGKRRNSFLSTEPFSKHLPAMYSRFRRFLLRCRT